MVSANNDPKAVAATTTTPVPEGGPLMAFNQAITLLEHKVRNLEKRKVKLDQYKSEQEKGKELNADQLAAVAKYTDVMNQLEFARDIAKSLQQFNVESVRALKKMNKRESIEREKNDIEKYKFLLLSMRVLEDLQVPKVKDDFLSGSNGAIKLTKEDLAALCELYSRIHLPTNDAGLQGKVDSGSEALYLLLEEKSKSIGGKSFKELKSLLSSLTKCDYFSGKIPTSSPAAAVKEFAQVEPMKKSSESTSSQSASGTLRTTPTTAPSGSAPGNAPAPKRGQPSTTVPIESIKAQSQPNSDVIDINTFTNESNGLAVSFLQDSIVDLERNTDIIDPAIVSYVPGGQSGSFVSQQQLQPQVQENNNTGGTGSEMSTFHETSDNNFSHFQTPKDSQKPSQEQTESNTWSNDTAGAGTGDNNTYNNNNEMHNGGHNNSYRGGRSHYNGRGGGGGYRSRNNGSNGGGNYNRYRGRGGGSNNYRSGGSSMGSGGQGYRQDLISEDKGSQQRSSGGRNFRGSYGRSGGGGPKDAQHNNQSGGLSYQI